MPGVYRPSAVIRLVIRVDEGANVAELLSKLEAPKSPNSQTSVYVVPDSDRGAELASTQSQLATLNKLSELTGGGDVGLQQRLSSALAHKRLLEPQSSNETPVSLEQSQDVLQVVVTVPVKRVEVERASFRTGDKASFTLNYYDAPFDARLMRSVGIEVLIGVMSPEEHDAGMHGLTRDDGSRYSVVEDAPGLQVATRFVGFLEKWNWNVAEGTIEGSATDIMSAMRDERLPEDVEIDHDLPIDEGIRALLELFPSLRGMTVVYGRKGHEEPGPIPSGAAARRKKVVKKGKARVRRNAENSTIWDHITDVCIGIGSVPVIDGVGLRIQPARTLYGAQPDVPKMVWGQNLSDLSFERDLGGFRNPTIEVRCYSPDDRKTYAARYPDPGFGFGVAIVGERPFPPGPKRANRVSPSGKNPEETIRVMTISGVGPDQLEAIARGIFEETARQEISGSFTTQDPSTFGVPFEVADLLDMHAGDPIAIDIDQRRQDEVGDMVSRLQGMTVAERVEHLLDSGFRQSVAVAYATLLDNTNLQTVFRLSGARLKFDKDDGLEVTGDFQNYITLRDNPQDAHATEASPQVQASTSGKKGPIAKRIRQQSAQQRPPETPAVTDLPRIPSLMERAPGSEYDEEIYADPQTTF